MRGKCLSSFTRTPSVIIAERAFLSRKLLASEIERVVRAFGLNKTAEMAIFK